MSSDRRRPTKVVSGGQTGVDRGALDAALDAGIPIGGWCPQGRRAEDGEIPDRFPLQETASPEYIVRTEQNVIDSDATLILAIGELYGGTRETRRFAVRHGHPVLVVDLESSISTEEVRAWLAEHSVDVLNVAGPRESSTPGIYHMARGFLRLVFSGSND